MDSLQTWIVFGVPGLTLAAAAFVGRSTFRALAGFGILVFTLLMFIAAGDPYSAGVVGIITFALVATGRGQTDDEHYEHHEHRERFTTTEGDLSADRA